MRLVLIRHGDPDYEHDSLTPQGCREAELLAGRISRMDIRDFYVSPLGRAKKTAEYTLKIAGRSARTLDWLEEFHIAMDIGADPELSRMYPDTPANPQGKRIRDIPWDMLPEEMARDQRYLDPEKWRTTLAARSSDLVERYDYVTGCFDDFLAEQGYVRDGFLYRCRQGNTDTLALFCHFGVSCVLLSRLWNVSPFALWHGLCLAPSSMSEIYTEERCKGTVHFRAARLGDISHLWAGGTEPSFSARFCEIFESEDRH